MSTLTMEEMDMIKEEMTDSLTEESKAIREVKHMTLDELKEVMGDEFVDELIEEENIVEGDQKAPVVEEHETNALSSIADKFGMSENEAMQMYATMAHIKAGKKFDILKTIPIRLQTIILGMLEDGNIVPNARQMLMSKDQRVVNQKRELIRMMFEEMVNSTGFDNSISEFTSEMDKLNGTLQSGPIKIWLEESAKRNEVDVLEKAKELEEQGGQEQYVANLRAINAGYVRALTLSDLKEFLASDNKFNKTAFDKIVRRYKRYLVDGDYRLGKYENNNYTMRQLYQVFCDKFSKEYSEDVIKVYTAALSATIGNMNKEYVEDTMAAQTIMQYGVRAVGFMQVGESEVFDKIMANIKECLDIIKGREMNG